jgi:hypothetical protein
MLATMVHPTKNKEELRHSRLLDMHKACYYRDVWDLRDKIYDEYLRPLSINSSNSVKRHLQKILVDVYHALLYDPDLCIAVSFNNNNYVLNQRYNKIHITPKTTDVMRDLIKLGFLHHHPGMPARNGYTSGPSFLSRVWPSDLLISLLKEVKLNVLNIRSHDVDKDPIILNKKVQLPKEPSKPRAKTKYNNVQIDYSDTAKIKAMRLIMVCYNALLRITHIDIPSAEKNYVSSYNEWGKELKCFITPQCFIHRTFSDSTFEKGGRIYGGWWERCASIHRQHIYINGNPTVEVDYNSIHPAILYHMEGLSFSEISGGRDFYDINVPELDNVPDYELGNYTREQLADFKRFLVKKLTLFALNVEDVKSLWSATRKSITAEDKNPESPVKRPPPDILEKITDSFLAAILLTIRQKHKPIAHHFLSGIASRLQLIDSNITSNLIEHFTALKVPILTIHDSYIIEKKWGQTLINAMQSCWMEEIERLTTDPDSKPKRSKYLYRLTSMKNHCQPKGVIDSPIGFENPEAGYDSGKTKLKQIGAFLDPSMTHGMREFQTSYWSKWSQEAVDMKPSAAAIPQTERYKMGLKKFKDWLEEPSAEAETPEIWLRYDGLKAMINADLYSSWLLSTPLWMKTIKDAAEEGVDGWEAERHRDLL